MVPLAGERRAGVAGEGWNEALRCAPACDGLYELAVLKGTPGKDALCYTTPITDDVVGHITPDEVTELLGKIEALPKA